MLQMLKTYMDAHWYREEGATAVEYGIMVAAIAAVIVTIVFVLGGQVNTAFTDTSDGHHHKARYPVIRPVAFSFSRRLGAGVSGAPAPNSSLVQGASRMKVRVKTRWQVPEGGATAVEYAILVSLIAAAVVTAVVALGGQLPPLFQSVIDGWS
jgi:pilus assembly protein Flp/PilA